MVYVCHKITKGEMAGKHTKLIRENLRNCTFEFNG